MPADAEYALDSGGWKGFAVSKSKSCQHFFNTHAKPPFYQIPTVRNRVSFRRETGAPSFKVDGTTIMCGQTVLLFMNF
jgi:hypothetical protein